MLLAGDTAMKVSIHVPAEVSLKFFIVHVHTRMISSIVQYCIISFNLRCVFPHLICAMCHVGPEIQKGH